MVENSGKHYVHIPVDELNAQKEVPRAVFNPESSRRMIIVGTDHNAFMCYSTLRQCGFEGHITVVTDSDDKGWF